MPNEDLFSNIFLQNLQRENGDVELDDVLREFLQIRDFISDYKTMMTHAAKRLTPAVQMYFARSDRTTIIKCEKPRITMTVQERMGRKKVSFFDIFMLILMCR